MFFLHWCSWRSGWWRADRIAIRIAAVTLLSAFPPTSAKASDVDLEIVLAVDASGSVDDAEFRLQLLGIAEALRDGRTQRAILSGPHGKIAISMLIWSDAAFPKFQTPWHILSDAASANDFADKAETFHRKAGRSRGIGGGGTAIGDAVAFAMRMLEENGISAIRKVVDVSGDGIETPPWFGTAVQLPEARHLAREQNVMVNGLAILTDFTELGEWYRQHVIVGPGSFVVEAHGFEDFKRAMREK
ncbi:MAG: DUF1194 domain-containing protein, partial [Hyphomicrobiaceae bacterium]